jgi:hypothetical protein
MDYVWPNTVGWDVEKVDQSVAVAQQRLIRNVS